MAKLKLPFELEKPSSNEYVTQASQIGHNNSSLSEYLDVLQEQINDAVSEEDVAELNQKINETSAQVVEIVGGEITIPIEKGEYTEGYYYNNYLKKTSYSGSPTPVIYQPVDVSAYVGETITIEITWDAYTDSSWCTLIGFRANNDIDSAVTPKGLVTEHAAHASAVNNHVTLEVEVLDNYLCIGTRDKNATINIYIEEETEGKISELEGEITELGGKIESAITEEDVDATLSPSSTNPIQNKAVNDAIAPILDIPVTLTLEKGTAENGYYYSNWAKKTEYTGSPSPKVYAPIDVSAYVGNILHLVVTWSTYTDSSWSYLLQFKSNSDVSAGGGMSGQILERTAHESAVNNRVEIDVEILDNFLLLGARNESTQIEVSVDYIQKGKIGQLEELVPIRRFVATNGNDENDGSESAPFATISQALKVTSDVVIKEGTYDVSSIDFSRNPSRKFTIQGEGDVALFAGTKILSEEGTLVNGYTKVYAASVSGTFNRHWIFQWGVDDEDTLISAAERTAYHRRQVYRCGFTAIVKVNSIAEIESYDGYAYYYDNGTLYYSRPSAVNENNYLWYANTNFLSGTNGKSLNMRGIKLFGASFNILDTVDSIIEGCAALGCYGGYGWSLDRSVNLLMIKCEAARAETNGSVNTGDGFNVHINQNANPNVEHCSFELRNCWSHDNWNDGYSDHEGCEGYINGGLYEHNCVGGAGGGITPAYGAHDVIKDAICQGNNGFGLMYTGDGTKTSYETGTFGTAHVVSVISRYNMKDGFNIPPSSENAIVDIVNCVSYNNEQYGYRAITGTMRCIGCIAENNTSGTYSNVENIASE